MTRNNEHGFPQMYDELTPICSNCGAVTEVNRGQGMDCSKCIEADNAFMEDCRFNDAEMEDLW